MKLPITMRVNGVDRSGQAEARMLLVDFLRQDLGLTGTHVGCEQGVCGACTILIDGRPVRSCLMLAVQAGGKDVLTVEGLGSPDELNPLQEALRQSHGFQCGFSAPGFLMTATALLEEQPGITDDQLRAELSGNLCRCTGYQSIIEGIAAAARTLLVGQSDGTR